MGGTRGREDVTGAQLAGRSPPFCWSGAALAAFARILDLGRFLWFIAIGTYLGSPGVAGRFYTS